MPESPEGPFREPESETPTTARTPTETKSPPASTEAAEPSPDSDLTLDVIDEDDEPIEAWKLILGVVAVFVVITIIGVIALVAFGGDDNGDGGTDEADPSLEVGEGTMADGFDRPDSGQSLGATDTGQTWDSVSGTWGIKDQQATLIEPSTQGDRSIAVIDMGAPNGTIQATGASMSNGWGLVFRYKSQFNYWYISASTDYASYNVYKVTRAADSDEITTTTVSQINLANAKDGAIVKIVMSGSVIDIFLDGKQRAQIIDAELSNANMVGLLAVGSAPVGARWDDFTATPDLNVEFGGGGTAPSSSVPGSGGTINVPAPTVPSNGGTADDAPATPEATEPPTTEADGDGAAEDGG